jgi:hypothetical protein
MSTLVEKVKSTAQAFSSKILSQLTHGTMKTGDPDNVSSIIGYGDLDAAEQEKLSRYLTGTAELDAKKLIDQGEEWFEEARAGRWEHHEDFFTGLAYWAGKQNYYWNQQANGGSGMMQAFPAAEGNTDFDEKFYQQDENYFAVMIERALARITAAYPDAWAAPDNDTEKDKLAAQVLRSINGHASRETNRDQLMEDVCLYMLLTTTTFIEVGWDAKAYADIGIPQPDGSVDYHKVQVGDICNAIVMAIDAYPDPNAGLSKKGIHGGAYFIKRHLMNVQDIADKWGREVSATSSGSTFGYLQQRMELIAGDYSRAIARFQNSTEVTEVWNRPSKQYPQGRFWVYSADRTLLWAGLWPYEKKDKYPFVAFEFKKNAGSVWALNMGKKLSSCQRRLNRLATYKAALLEWSRPTILAPSNCNIAPDDFLNPTLYKVIGYDGVSTGGAEPKFWVPPPMGDDLFKYKQELIETMEALAGVRDLNGADAQPISSGTEYGLRLKTDKERITTAIKMMGRGRKELYEWDGALMRQFGATFPRLLGIDDMAIPTRDLQGPNAAATKLVDLQALRDGSTRVILEEGSGEARLPEAQEEQLQEITKLLISALAQPGGLAIVQWYLGQSQAIRSDAEVDRLFNGVRQLIAENAQQQAAAAMNVQQLKGNQANQQQQNKVAADQAQQQAETEADQQKAAIDVHSQFLIQQYRTQADMAVEQQRFQNAMQQIYAKGSMPSIALAGKLSPGGEYSAEQKSGLSPSDIAAITKMLMPAPPMGNSKGQSNGTSQKSN